MFTISKLMVGEFELRLPPSAATFGYLIVEEKPVGVQSTLINVPMSYLQYIIPKG